MIKRHRFTAREKEALYAKQNGICKGCERKLDIIDFHMDHVKSLADSGPDRISNIQLLCGHCNTVKGSGTQSELRKRLKRGGWIRKRGAKWVGVAVVILALALLFVAYPTTVRESQEMVDKMEKQDAGNVPGWYGRIVGAWNKFRPN